MRWEIVEDYDALSTLAAEMMLTALAENPALVLGLPTGRTPEGMYAQVVKACRSEYHCFSRATTFNLDEYVGVDAQHPASYAAYMKKRLFDHVDVDPAHRYIPDGMAAKITTEQPGLPFAEALQIECARYENAIEDCGLLDLTFLGLGTNGHIGFNEPGASFLSRTRVVTLSESTRKSNAPFFGTDPVPDRAITMGIATILGSSRIVVLASGANKAEVVRRLRSDPVSEVLPASALRMHDDVMVILDAAAATAIREESPPSSAHDRN